MRKLLSVVLISLFAVFSVAAQEDDSEWFWDKNISKIEFNGLNAVKKSDLNAIVNAYTDIPFTEENYNDLMDRLSALDFFDDIEPYANHDPKNANNVIVVLNVKERPTVSLVTFSGNQKIRNGELRDIVKTKTSDIFVEAKVLMDERLIRNHYIEKGYSDSQVSHKIETTDSGVQITFIIKEGANTVIREIHTTGNTIVSERSLKSKLNLKEIGLFKDGAFQNSALEMDKRTIVSYYQQKGYIDAAVLDVQIDSEYNEEKQRQELVLNFIIQEGAQYVYSGLKLQGNEIFTDEELLSKMKLKEGAIFDAIKFQEGLAEIQGVYVDNGYMSVQLYPIPNKDPERREISYDLSITESVRSHVENVIIKGNTKTKDYVIRREIPIEEGDVFSREKVISGMRNLYNLQFFSNIVPDFQQGSEPNLFDVVFAVEEQSTTTLNFGMTFSGVTDPNDIPISLYFKLENSNLFGEGKAISTETTLAKNEQSLNFSYSQNWIGDLPITLSQSLSFAHTNSATPINMFQPDLSLDQSYYYMDYEGYTASLGTAVGRRWTPDFAILTASAGLNNSLTRYSYDEALYAPTDLGISMFANRWGLMNSLWVSASADARDINYDPSEGWFASERLTWSGLIPGLEKEFFLKSDTKVEGYYTLFDIPVTETWNFKAVLAGYMGFTGLFPAADTTISESNRLYIDGMFNGRGWTELYKSSRARGQALWSSQVEVRFPLVAGIVGLDLFHDTAVVKPTVGAMFSDLHMSDVYMSFGPAIRILIPQFPLHLMFAFRYKYDGNGFHFADNPYQFVLSFNLLNK